MAVLQPAGFRVVILPICLPRDCLEVFWNASVSKNQKMSEQFLGQILKAVIPSLNPAVFLSGAVTANSALPFANWDQLSVKLFILNVHQVSPLFSQVLIQQGISIYMNSTVWLFPLKYNNSSYNNDNNYNEMMMMVMMMTIVIIIIFQP